MGRCRAVATPAVKAAPHPVPQKPWGGAARPTEFRPEPPVQVPAQGRVRPLLRGEQLRGVAFHHSPSGPVTPAGSGLVPKGLREPLGTGLRAKQQHRAKGLVPAAQSHHAASPISPVPTWAANPERLPSAFFTRSERRERSGRWRTQRKRSQPRTEAREEEGESREGPGERGCRTQGTEMAARQCQLQGGPQVPKSVQEASRSLSLVGVRKDRDRGGGDHTLNVRYYYFFFQKP